MPNHCRVPLNSAVRRLHGVRVESRADGCVLGFRMLSKGWPTIAKRLVSRGFLVVPKIVGTRIRLNTNAPFDEAVSLLIGRRRVPATRRIWLVSGALALVSSLALMSLVSGPQAQAVRPKPKLALCSSQSIASALGGESSVAHIAVEKELAIGGVRAGTLTCNGTRYSYALELKEQGRLLKLERLDP